MAKSWNHQDRRTKSVECSAAPTPGDGSQPRVFRGTSTSFQVWKCCFCSSGHQNPAICDAVTSQERNNSWKKNGDFFPHNKKKTQNGKS